MIEELKKEWEEKSIKGGKKKKKVTELREDDR